MYRNMFSLCLLATLITVCIFIVSCAPLPTIKNPFSKPAVAVEAEDKSFESRVDDLESRIDNLRQDLLKRDLAFLEIVPIDSWDCSGMFKETTFISMEGIGNSSILIYRRLFQGKECYSMVIFFRNGDKYEFGDSNAEESRLIKPLFKRVHGAFLRSYTENTPLGY